MLDEATVRGRLSSIALHVGLGELETQRTITSGLTAGIASPRKLPDWHKPTPAVRLHQPTGATESPTTTTPESLIVRASEIVPRKVEWLWPGRIPLGKLTTFAGVGGLGKTFVLCDIAARVSSGGEWPDAPGIKIASGQVLFISGEDEPDDTLVPRLIEMGADLTKITFLADAAQDRFTLHDLQLLEAALDQTGEGVRFVAIDPPTAYLGGTDDHKNAELRQLLTPLKTLAARRRLSIVFNTHVNKPQGKVEAMMRVMGSVAWVNAVRAAHMVARDPEDRTKRLFVGMKLNVGKERKGLAYRLADGKDDLARVEWLGEVDTTADQAINNDKTKKKRSVIAAEWLAEKFACGVDELPSKAIFADKDAETTLSNDALREAKEAMGIKAHQKHDPEPGGGRNWWWYWPQEARDYAVNNTNQWLAAGCKL